MTKTGRSFWWTHNGVPQVKWFLISALVLGKGHTWTHFVSLCRMIVLVAICKISWLGFLRSSILGSLPILCILNTDQLTDQQFFSGYFTGIVASGIIASSNQVPTIIHYFMGSGRCWKNIIFIWLEFLICRRFISCHTDYFYVWQTGRGICEHVWGHLYIDWATCGGGF